MMLEQIIKTLISGNCEVHNVWSETTYNMNTISKHIVEDINTGIRTSFIAEQYEENDFCMIFIEQQNSTSKIVANIYRKFQ